LQPPRRPTRKSSPQLIPTETKPRIFSEKKLYLFLTLSDFLTLPVLELAVRMELVTQARNAHPEMEWPQEVVPTATEFVAFLPSTVEELAPKTAHTFSQLHLPSPLASALQLSVKPAMTFANSELISSLLQSLARPLSQHQ